MVKNASKNSKNYQKPSKTIKNRKKSQKPSKSVKIQGKFVKKNPKHSKTVKHN